MIFQASMTIFQGVESLSDPDICDRRTQVIINQQLISMNYYVVTPFFYETSHSKKQQKSYHGYKIYYYKYMSNINLH